MELLKRFLRPKTTALLIVACIQQSAGASEVILHHAQVFLNSIYMSGRIQAPRLGLAAMHTHLAHPSLLQEWGVIASDAAAAYNSLTNTLVLTPEMTVFDPEFGGARLASLQEIRHATNMAARVNAGIIFHEMSHAEFDFFVEEHTEAFDKELMNVIRAELPAIVAANGLSRFKAVALPSEIFAYYREELVGMILGDVAEIKLASGVDPDLNTCTPIRTFPNNVRNFSPNSTPYSARVDLRYVYVTGSEVKLDHDPEAAKRLNAALFAHTTATMKFPESRAELLKLIRSDKAVRQAMATCRALRPKT